MILLTGIFILSSCSQSFLDLYPETNVTSAIFYKTMTHFDQALNASYTRFRNIANNGLFMDEMRSDNAFIRSITVTVAHTIQLKNRACLLMMRYLQMGDR